MHERWGWRIALEWRGSGWSESTEGEVSQRGHASQPSSFILNEWKDKQSMNPRSLTYKATRMQSTQLWRESLTHTGSSQWDYQLTFSQSYHLCRIRNTFLKVFLLLCRMRHGIQTKDGRAFSIVPNSGALWAGSSFPSIICSLEHSAASKSNRVTQYHKEASSNFRIGDSILNFLNEIFLKSKRPGSRKY